MEVFDRHLMQQNQTSSEDHQKEDQGLITNDLILSQPPEADLIADSIDINLGLRFWFKTILVQTDRAR